MAAHPTRPAPSANAIAASTQMGTVALTVSDLSRSARFYERVLGLRPHELEDGGLAVGVPGEPALLALRGDRGARPLDRRATGLFHLAVLVPTRCDLAHALARLSQSGWPLDGASDHLVSEALYLSDPDGNGIEIYRDRPRAEWTRDEAGAIRMATLPLDLAGLSAELTGATAIDDTAPARTRIGHVHLQVSDLERTEAFYHGVLGFDVTVRTYPGALFVSAGGYHHHVGLNTWHSLGAAPPAEGAVGLRSFDVLLPDRAAVDDVLVRVRAAGPSVEPVVEPGGGAVFRDPSGNAIRLRCA